MRIAMLLHKAVDHDSRVRREATALAQAGHQVTVIHLPGGPQPARDLDGVRILSASPKPWLRRRLPFHAYRAVFLLGFLVRLRQVRPDVVHAHDAAMLLPGWLGARSVGARLVYDSHEYATGVPYRSRGWALLVAALERSLIGRCSGVITVSDGIADRLKEQYGLEARPTVVRNVPDASLADRATAVGDLRSELGIETGPLVLHQGSIAEGRGCEILIRAIANLDDAHVLFLGADDESRVEELRDLAQALDVDGRVHFVPPVPIEELLGHTRQADVGVTLLEDSCENHRLALPNKVFEYLAAGVPVVASNLSELSRLLSSTQRGVLVDPQCPRSVARGLAIAIRELPADDLDGRWTWARERHVLTDFYSEMTRPPQQVQP